MDQWQGGVGNSANAILVPNAETLQEQGGGRNLPDNYGRRNRSSDGFNTGYVRPQRAQQDVITQNVPAPRSAPAPQPDRVAPAERRNRAVGENVREE